MPLLDAAIAVDFDARVMNAILTKQAIKASIRGAKTDKTDAVIIARLGVRGEGLLYRAEPYLTAKIQTRSYTKINEIRYCMERHLNHVNAIGTSALTTDMNDKLQTIRDTFDELQALLQKEAMRSIQGELFTNLQTIPGIGPVIAANLISEIQDMGKVQTSQAAHRLHRA